MSTSPIALLTPEQLAALVRSAVDAALTEHADASVPRALLDRAELARALGVSVRTLDTLRGEGLPTLWILDSPRFELEAVLAWLRDRRK